MSSEMFENYPQPEDYVPDNRPKFIYTDTTDRIIRGASNMHVFKFDFKFSEYCTEFKVTYKQSLSVIVEYGLGDPATEVKDIDGKSFVVVHMPVEDSLLFKPGDAKAQIKLHMIDGKINFGDINEVKVIDTLEEDE